MTLTSDFTFVYAYVYVYVYVYAYVYVNVYACAYAYAYAYAYACVCPVPLPMPGLCGFVGSFICYVSTHFRYILTTLVLIRNIFRFTTLKINAYLFFRRGYGKLIV